VNKKALSIILLIFGTTLTLISLIADLIGISGDPLAFGWKQILGTSIGVAIILAGLWLFPTNQE